MSDDDGTPNYPLMVIIMVFTIPIVGLLVKIMMGE